MPAQGDDLSEYLRLRLLGFSEHEILTVREELRSLRQRLRSELGTPLGGAAEKRNRPRFVRDKVRAYYRSKYLSHGPTFSREVLVCTYRKIPLLEAVYPERERRWKSFLERETVRRDIDLKDFSFVTNPAETMAALKQIAAAECENATVMLNFRDDECLDVGAYLILQAMRERMIPVFHGGIISDSVRNVFILLGLDKAMRMRLRMGDPEEDNVWPLKLQQRRLSGPRRTRRPRIDPSRAEKVLKSLVDTINRWLARMANVVLLTCH